ncbi:MAG: hypothetical protein AB4040_16525 [Synechococcus sp.]
MNFVKGEFDRFYLDTFQTAYKQEGKNIGRVQQGVTVREVFLDKISNHSLGFAICGA